ncbi:type II toxin-antitoxin system YoeB family toxin [Halomonas tibetensis]
MVKPEPLKHNLSGLWSRRLSQQDRLIYRFDDSKRSTNPTFFGLT